MENQKFNSPHSPLTIAAVKQQWRELLKKLRQNLSADRRIKASIHACQQLGKLCEAAPYVLSFASFGSEINLWPFNQELASQGRLVLPRVEVDTTLQLFQVSDFNQLELHRLGMLEPKISECPLIDDSLIPIALIPGLGFDRETKYRLGYGQGYYDRLLKEMISVETWGIGFLEQGVKDLPYTYHDIPLKEIYLF